MIVTADDFGLSADVNQAILDAFHRGLISTTSVMANMPGFNEACDMARQNGLTGRVGTHVVLTEGEPLSQEIRSCGRFCDSEGRFRHWRATDRALRLKSSERRAVERELQAQIIRCRGEGLGITHIDSHQHVHNKLAIAAIVIAVAQEFGIRRVRIAHNTGSRMGLANRASKAWINRDLRRKSLAGTRWFGGVDDYLRVKTTFSPVQLRSFEIVTHPVYRGGLLVDAQHPSCTLEQLLSVVTSHP